MARKGETTPDNVRAKQSAELGLTLDERIARDDEMLRALGQTKVWEFSEHMQVSEATAKNRLRRLYEAGLADRYRQQGAVAWTYTTTIRPGETVS